MSKAEIAWRRSLCLRAVGQACPYCGRPMDRPTTDHMIPLSRGGISEDANCIACCRECNEHKADQTLEEWAAWLEYTGDRRAHRVLSFRASIKAGSHD